MRLHFDRADAVTRITAYGNGFVEVNEERHTSSIIVWPDRTPAGWRPVGPQDLQVEDIDTLLEEGPEIVLLGTGRRQRFPPGELLEPAFSRRIGIEVMDTRAACRTFNVLVSENRRVVAGLILEALEP